jgi:hypothetical protein
MAARKTQWRERLAPLVCEAWRDCQLIFTSLNQFRRLRVHHGKRVDIHEAFLSLGVRFSLLTLLAN